LSKGGLNAATKSLAIEYAKRGIRVNALALGPIKTPMHAADTHGQLAALHPVGQMGEVSDVVNAIIYLESAGFVTGVILPVDGQTAGHLWDSYSAGCSGMDFGCAATRIFTVTLRSLTQQALRRAALTCAPFYAGFIVMDAHAQ
jgi:hypothetical protein